MMWTLNGFNSTGQIGTRYTIYTIMLALYHFVLFGTHFTGIWHRSTWASTPTRPAPPSPSAAEPGATPSTSGRSVAAAGGLARGRARSSETIPGCRKTGERERERETAIQWLFSQQNCSITTRQAGTASLCAAPREHLCAFSACHWRMLFLLDFIYKSPQFFWGRPGLMAWL